MMDIPRKPNGLLDRQAVFGVAAVVAQGRASFEQNFMGGVSCLYRAPDGCKCLIGHFIPDEKYDPWMEGHAPESVLDGSLTQRDADFLVQLQQVHDDAAEHTDFIPAFLSYAESFAAKNWLQFNF